MFLMKTIPYILFLTITPYLVVQGFLSLLFPIILFPKISSKNIFSTPKPLNAFIFICASDRIWIIGKNDISGRSPC
ncbi:MAG: hypothetical protein LBQ31_06620 [Bacteroidales bacterium]|nr:hypothetical protein [Bacteroidales bacterium]